MLSSPTTYRSRARTDVQVLPGASHSDARSYVAGRGPLPTQQLATHDPATGRVRSEFDIPTAPQLELTLDAAQAPPVVLDLREHALIDGCGKHAIACAGSRARQAAASWFSFACPPVHTSENAAVHEAVQCRVIVTIRWTAARGKEAHRDDRN
jgi:anti-anti-sigma regulatory factor